MAITAGELAAINAILESLNAQMAAIEAARDDVIALLRIATSINSNTIEDAILADAKLRGKTAAAAIVTLLT